MPPSYICASSYQLKWLSEEDKQFLDTQPWVFAVNVFLSHWKHAGFRPSVWIYGDNHDMVNVEHFAGELAAIRRDPRLQERPRYLFAALEQQAEAVYRVVNASGLKVHLYRRGDPWRPHQEPATSIDGRIYHYGSTLTNAVNLAWILNPGEEIRLLTNPYGPHQLHFWNPANQSPDAWKSLRPKEGIWLDVVRCMWKGLSELRYKHDLPIVDCTTEHEEELPARALPRGKIRG